MMSNKPSEIWDRIQEEKKNPELREKRLEEESRKLTLALEWQLLNSKPLLTDNPYRDEQ